MKKTRIIIFEKDNKHASLLFDVLLDLLDIQIKKAVKNPDNIQIETTTYQIIIKYIREESFDIMNSPLRALKVDLVINNTKNTSIDMYSPIITMFSKFKLYD